MTTHPLRAILPTALIAMAIAAVLPFDKALQAITAGHTGPHVLLVGLLALAGGWLGRRARLDPGGNWRAGVPVAVAMAAYVLLLDVVLFRPMVHGTLLTLAHMPLVGRLGVFMARAFNENVIYRLFSFSALMAALRGLYRGREVPLAMVLLAGLAVQCANIGVNVLLAVDHRPGMATLCYWMLRYVAPGVVWAWLYWRHGFAPTEVASVGGHLVFQPLFGLLV